MKTPENYYHLARIKSLMIMLILIQSSSSSSFMVEALLRGPRLGVNYGRIGSNLPPHQKTVELVRSLSIKHVKTFDMDPSVIQAFAHTNIFLSLCVPDELISSLASNASLADFIIRTSVRPFYPHTRISSISVGNEVSNIPLYAPILVPAMENIYTALKNVKLHKKIQVSTPQSMAVLSAKFPPSAARFQESIAESVIRPILTFLNEKNSSFMVNLYPYLTHRDFTYFPLDFALFSENVEDFNYTDPGSGLLYTNLFDVLVDSFNSAAFSLGFRNLPLVVTETGWPSEGSPGASLDNAALFNQRVVKHVTARPIKGTPMKPGIPVPTFVFALFDEDQKIGDPVEKHWGLLYGNGTKKYDLGYHTQQTVHANKWKYLQKRRREKSRSCQQ